MLTGQPEKAGSTSCTGQQPAGKTDNVLCITVITDQSALKKSIASHMNNIYLKNTSAADFLHTGSKEAHIFAHARHKKTAHKGTPTPASEAYHALQGT